MTVQLKAAVLALFIPVLTAGTMAGAGVSEEPAGGEPVVTTDSTVVVYYFHRTARCKTCLTIEALAKEALDTYLANALAAGRLIWPPINIEEPGNEHFEDDFQLEFSSLIVAAHGPEDGVSWWNLERVWDLVGEREEFIEYVRLNVAGVLENGAPREVED